MRKLRDARSKFQAVRQDAAATASNAPELLAERASTAPGFLGHAPELVPNTPGTEDEDNGPHDYTWKTILCDCETSEQANQLCKALKQAGIESWIEGPGSQSPFANLELANPRVLVAADQLDQARAIIANPIPLEIIDQSESEEPEFIPPTCPRCGTNDPVLEGVDPGNTWRCEQCGEQWTDPASVAEDGAQKPGQTPL